MKYLPDIRATIRQLLRDEFVSSTTDLDWEDDEIDIHIGECLGEISERSPSSVREVLTTIANSRVLDISSIDDLIRIESLEYPTGYYPRKERGFRPLYNDTIEIITDTTPSAGGSGTLTGTVTFTNGSAAVTGSGTDFDGELEAGYHIKKSSGTKWYRIYSITSDTALTLAEPCLETTGADTASVTQYCYETVYLFCEKTHTLTETSSTLRPQHERILVLGVCGKAAISKARSLINKVNIGGVRTPAEMESWGIGQLVLYRNELARISKPRTSITYPTG